jgi:hypothetical protein
MNSNTLLAIAICAFVVFSTIVITSPKSEHEKRMDIIEEKKALLQLEGNIRVKEIKVWVDSMQIEVNK